MKKVIAIHQPDYIPWLGFYYKMAHCDTFVYLDDAQYSNEADHNVNVIKTSQGAYRLKIPVKQHLGDLICNVRTKDELKWKDKHLKTIAMNYCRAPFFDKYFSDYEKIIRKEYRSIADLNMEVNRYICEGFGICPNIIKSSDMQIHSAKEQRVIDICIRAGGDTYLSGTGARVYQQEEHFINQGLRLEYIDYKPISYRQLWPKVGFMQNMSVIDFIFNCGFDWEYVEKQVKELNNGNREFY